MIFFLSLNLVFSFFFSTAMAYIPPTRMLLEKLTDNSGKTGYEIVKEVRINATVPLIYKEVWQIENERTLRVTISPADAKSPTMQILYVGGQKIIVNGKNRETRKMPIELTERVFHFRSAENLAAYLANLQILSSAIGNLDFARLNRSQGVVNYGLGKKSDSEASQLYPYLWIEQDRFVVRKLRYESGVEITADGYVSHPKGLYHPESISLMWGDSAARVRTLSVISKKWPPQTFQSSSLENSQSFLQTALSNPKAAEFYSRFR